MAGILRDIGNYKSKSLKALLAALVIGTAAGSLAGPVGHFLIFCAILISALALIFCWPKKDIRLFLLLLIFFLVGAWRVVISQPPADDPSKIYYYNGQTVRLIAQVETVESRLSQQQLTLRPLFLLANGHRHTIGGNLLAIVDLYPQYAQGQLVELSGEIDQPQTYQDFDYRRYLARYQIYSVCYYPQLDIIRTDQVGVISGFIYNSRRRLIGRLNASIAEPAVSILSAMVWGERGVMPRQLTDDFSRVGLSHIVAISGMHIAVILLILNKLLITLGLARPRAFWGSVLIVVSYVLFIGAPASAVRAAIMGIIVLLAAQLGRLANSVNALMLAASLMLMVDPRLISDVGFQLSFTATAGIIYVYPYLRQKLSWLNKLFNQAADMVAVTLSAQILTLPLILWHFGGVSLLGLLVNVLVLPVVPVIIILGLVNSAVALLSLTLGRLVGIFSYLAIGYVVVVTQWAARLPVAYLRFKGINLLVLVLFYLVLAYFLLAINRHKIYDN